MKCRNPVMLPNYFVPCGQCANCLRQRAWLHTSMIVAESLTHGQTQTFATLTYDDDNQPRDHLGRGVLNKTDVQRFLKRLRESQEGRIRYYLVGEYGSRTSRPHYHLALFGYPNCHKGRSNFRRTDRISSQVQCCGPCNRLRKAWGHGIIMLGELTPASAGYVAGYITKKFTDSPGNISDGLPPQFSTMSLRPGLGHVFALQYIRKLSVALEGQIRPQDVPRVFKHSGTEYRFNRNHRNIMRAWCGFQRKISQKEMDDYCQSYSTLPWLQEEKPKTAFLDAWQGERQRFQAKQKVKHETL